MPYTGALGDGDSKDKIDFAQDKDIKTRDDQGRLLGKLGDGSFGVVCRGKFIIKKAQIYEHQQPARDE